MHVSHLVSDTSHIKSHIGTVYARLVIPDYQQAELLETPTDDLILVSSDTPQEMKIGKD